jgi:phosphatidate cytidylyltransferase
MSPLAKRVRMGATLAAAAAALLWLHPRFPAGSLSLAVVTLLVAFSIWELDRMGHLGGRGLAWALGLPAVVASLVLSWMLAGAWRIGGLTGLGGLYLLALALVFPEPDWLPRPRAWRSPTPSGEAPEPGPPVGARLLAAWLLPPLFSIVLIDREFGTRGLVALIVLAKVGDNAGYFVGRAIGGHHPFPRVSPGKTVAGCVASLAAGIVAGALLLPYSLGTWGATQAALGALIGGLINVAAQAGDLSESWVKRRAGVKDSSALLGPSGGVLDVIDSLLLAAPVALVAWSLAYAAPLP